MGVGSNLVIDIIVGIAGAFFGGWIMRQMGSHEAVGTPGAPIGFSWRNFLVALLGAIILLALVKLLS